MFPSLKSATIEISSNALMLLLMLQTKENDTGEAI